MDHLTGPGLTPPHTSSSGHACIDRESTGSAGPYTRSPRDELGSGVSTDDCAGENSDSGA